MKAIIHGITVLFVLTLCQYCSVYYNAREQSAYIPNVVNHIDRVGIEPQVSVHIPCKKVGLFFQTVYYGPLWYGVNANTYNVMDQAALPLLMSIGFTFNPGSSKNKL
jgi:hypothetical protein